MKKELLSTSNYPVIHKVISDISKNGGIENLKVYIYSDKQYTGKAGSNGIYITSALVEDYKKYPHVLKFFVGHEIIHFKNREYGIKKAANTTLAVLLSVFCYRKPMYKDNAITLLSEMRANIEGATLSALTDTEIISSQSIAQHNNDDSVIPKSYKVGYPDRAMIADYCSRYKKFNKTIAKEILSDFTKKMKIKNEKRFIREVIIKFFSSST